MENNFIELKNLDRAEKLLSGIPNGVQRALTASINKSLITLRKELKKKVSADYKVRATIVDNTMSIKKATWSSLAGTISSKGRPLNLVKFFSSINQKNIYVKIKKSGGRKIVTGSPKKIGRAFMATMDNEHRGIFQKVNKKVKKVVKRKNGPKVIKVHKIVELRTVSISQMLGNENIMQYYFQNEEVEKMVEKNLEKEIDRILKGYL